MSASGYVPVPDQDQVADLREGTALATDLRPVAVSGNVGTATCALHAGWFTVQPKPTKTDKHPSTAWGVTAVYLGNGNWNSKQKTKMGTVTI